MLVRGRIGLAVEIDGDGRWMRVWMARARTLLVMTLRITDYEHGVCLKDSALSFFGRHALELYGDWKA